MTCSWRLPWPPDRDADLGVVVADAGGLIVAIAVTAPLIVVGMLPDDEPFYEAETDDLPGRWPDWSARSGAWSMRRY